MNVHPQALTCLLDPCPAWLIRSAYKGLGRWTESSMLKVGMLPLALKQAVVSSLLKKPSLAPFVLGYQPILNLSLLRKVIKQVVASPLQKVLKETHYLVSFQSGFRPGFRMETPLVTLVDNLHKGLNGGVASLLVPLDLIAASGTIDHVVLLELWAELGIGALFSSWSSPSWLMVVQPSWLLREG